MSRTVIHLPAVALRGMTILPGMVAHFDISRDRSIHAIEEAMVGDQKIFLITQQDASVEEPARDDLYQIGVIAEVKQVIKMPNERIGKRRVSLFSVTGEVSDGRGHPF